MNNTIPNEQVKSISWRDYYTLCKPNVVALMLVTALVGMFLATPHIVPWDILIFGNLGIALCAGSAATVNHVLDAHMDAVMARTQNRPLPQGKIQPKSALLFAFVLGLAGMLILLFLVNALTAWLTLATLLGYALIYTVYLKHATPQNIVIGGLAGAAPPLLGWTAVTNSIDGHALLLVLIIFAWTPPHFWALALHKKDEYAKVNVPMLPVTHGDKYTRLQILLYTIILFIATILPFATGMSGLIYLLGAASLGIGFIYWAIILYLNRQSAAAINTFKYSIIYLFCLFIVLLVDHYFPIYKLQLQVT